MAHEKVRATDLRVALPIKEQTDYATALVGADFTRSFDFNEAIFPTPTVQFSGAGPRPMRGHEWGEGGAKIDQRHDLQFSLARPANTLLTAWAYAFLLGSVVSVKDATFNHWTHTITPRDPIASGGLRQARVTSVYFEETGPDAGRSKGIFPSIAVNSVNLSGSPGESALLAVDFVGSGKDNADTAITVPALAAGVELLMRGAKFEMGPFDGAFTDFTQRLIEWNLAMSQNLDLEGGYRPNAVTPLDGRFRSQFEYTSRTLAMTMALEKDRSNQDVFDWMVAQQRLKAKVTIETLIKTDASSAITHSLVIDVPDFELAESPEQFQNDAGIYALSVPNEMINKKDGSTQPFTVTVINDEASYFA